MPPLLVYATLGAFVFQPMLFVMYLFANWLAHKKQFAPLD
jgi:hypothetical protein